MAEVLLPCIERAQDGWQVPASSFTFRRPGPHPALRTAAASIPGAAPAS